MHEVVLADTNHDDDDVGTSPTGSSVDDGDDDQGYPPDLTMNKVRRRTTVNIMRGIVCTQHGL